MHYVRVCWIWRTCNGGKRVAARKHPGMAAVDREPGIGQENQVAKSGELCIYCVLGKLALDLYAALDIFPTNGARTLLWFHCKAPVWSYEPLQLI